MLTQKPFWILPGFIPWQASVEGQSHGSTLGCFTEADSGMGYWQHDNSLSIAWISGCAGPGKGWSIPATAAFQGAGGGLSFLLCNMIQLTLENIYFFKGSAQTAAPSKQYKKVSAYRGERNTCVSLWSQQSKLLNIRPLDSGTSLWLSPLVVICGSC